MESQWIERLVDRVRAVELYGPRDAGNPVPGHWTVVGPLSEYRFSPIDLDHAARLYLAQVCRDEEAQESFRVRPK